MKNDLISKIIAIGIILLIVFSSYGIALYRIDSLVTGEDRLATLIINTFLYSTAGIVIVAGIFKYRQDSINDRYNFPIIKKQK